jgi:hypothetical protein
MWSRNHNDVGFRSQHQQFLKVVTFRIIWRNVSALFGVCTAVAEPLITGTGTFGLGRRASNQQLAAHG